MKPRVWWIAASLTAGMLPVSVLGQPVSSAPALKAAPANNPHAVFLDLLKAYRNYPEFFNLIGKGAETYDDVDPRVVVTLPEKVLQSRINQFNRDFLTFRKVEKNYKTSFDAKMQELEQIPLSDGKRRGKAELDAKVLESRYRQARKVIFLLSIDANSSILEAIQTLPKDKRVVKDEKANPAPKLPFGTRETRQQRLTKKEIDKVFLTPVDAEFGNTQLGKKVIKDLGAPIDAWSYDDGKDELYVLVGNNVSKIRVKEDTPGIRYIQTRVGARYDEPIGSDTKVDMLSAEGKFLTGDSKAASLFGKRLGKDPVYLDQLPPGHSENDGHDHNHNHQ